jgi:type IV fimbrial biogenesis protein FimT
MQVRYPRPVKCERRQRGITLVECCTTVGIVAVVTATAAPNLGGLAGGTDRAYAEELRSTIALARSEAIKGSSRAVICKSNDGSSCSRDGGWSQGWMLFSDTNHNGQRDGDEPVITIREALAPGWRVTGNGSMARYVAFEADGAPAQFSGAFQAGTFTICRSSREALSARSVIMSATGRVRTESRTATACV